MCVCVFVFPSRAKDMEMVLLRPADKSAQYICELGTEDEVGGAALLLLCNVCADPGLGRGEGA